MKKILTTPIQNKDIESLRIGDIVYLSGSLATCRDDGHRRLVEAGVWPEFPLAGGAIFHAGPIVKKTETGWETVAIGPTTSMRMERFEAGFIRLTGVKLIIGKGGMGPDTAQACKEYKAIHTVFPGGCAVSAAECVLETPGVEWEDFGMPEAFWIMRVREFGPLIVSIDTQGNNLFEENKKAFRARKEAQIEEISKYVRRYNHAGTRA